MFNKREIVLPADASVISGRNLFSPIFKQQHGAEKFIVRCLFFFVTFFLLDILSTFFLTSEATVIWYPPSGLCLAVLIEFGPAFFFPCAVAFLLSNLFVFPVPLPFTYTLLWSLILPGCYLMVARFIVKKIKRPFQSFQVRDIAYFTTALIISVTILTLIAMSGIAYDLTSREFWLKFFDWWVGEFLGVLIFCPLFLLIIQLRRPWVKAELLSRFGKKIKHASQRRLIYLLFVVTVLFSVIWVVFDSRVESKELFYLCFLPLIFVVPFFGMPGAVISLFLINVGSISAVLIFEDFTLTDLFTVHTQLLVLGIAGFLFAAMVNERMSQEEQKDKALKRLTKSDKELRNSLHDLNTYLYRSSHDLRTPIVNMHGLLNMLEDELSPGGNSHEVLRMLRESSRKMDETVHQLNSITVVTNTKVTATLVNAEEVFTRALERIKEHRHFNQATFENISVQGFSFTSDACLLELLLVELFTNALGYQKNELLHVCFEAKAENNQTIIRISDNGKGMREAHNEEIFDIFFRADSQVQCTGLELYAAKKIAEKLNGTITLQSLSQQGIAITVTLPRATLANGW